MASQHFLNQSWFISWVLRHSPKANSTGNAHEINQHNTFENCTLKITQVQWVNHDHEVSSFVHTRPFSKVLIFCSLAPCALQQLWNLLLSKLIRWPDWPLFSTWKDYRQVYNIRRTIFQHLKDSRTVLRLSLPNPLKPDVKSITQM